jgi:ABC-type Fe3+ transport system substrate-binding protein
VLLRTLIRTASVVALCLICLILSSRRTDAALIDDAKKEGALVFYGSMTTEHHGKLVAAFNQKYPFIRVEGFRVNSLTVVNRVLTEQRSGRPLVDVMNVDELSGWVLKDRGLLQSYLSNEARAFPDAFRDPEGYFTCCTYVVTNVIAYNRKLVRKEDAAKLFVDYVLSEEGQRFVASLGRTVVRSGIKMKYPQLVEGVRLHPVKPDIGKDYETLSTTYYQIVN